MEHEIQHAALYGGIRRACQRHQNDRRQYKRGDGFCLFHCFDLLQGLLYAGMHNRRYRLERVFKTNAVHRTASFSKSVLSCLRAS